MGKFDKMRQSLIERGLIRRDGKRFVVTEAGDSHTDRLIYQLKRQRIALDV